MLDYCVFDEVNCSEGIKALRMYRKEWNDRLGVFKNSPRDDDNGHYADALRTFAMGYQEKTMFKRKVAKKRKVVNSLTGF